jgi:hypothetical protein
LYAIARGFVDKDAALLGEFQGNAKRKSIFFRLRKTSGKTLLRFYFAVGGSAPRIFFENIKKPPET